VNPSHYLLHFAASQAAKLVKLELNWNTGEKSDNDLLNNILLNNKNLEEIDITTTNKGWISTEVVRTMALELPKLKNVCFSTSRIRLFFGDGSRRLWPHTCWLSRRENHQNLELKYTDSQVQVFQRVTNSDDGEFGLDAKATTEEHQTLCCLRLIHSKCRFSDFALISDFSCGELMDPLMCHEYKCPKGLMYSCLDDSDPDEDLDYWNFSSPELQVCYHDESDSDHSETGATWACGNIYN